MSRISVLVALAAIVAATAGALAVTGQAGGDTASVDPALLPDLRAVVPRHLQLVNKQQQEILRFSNGIANTGGGPWALRPQHQLGLEPTTTAIQEIRTNGAFYRCGTQPKQITDCYEIVAEYPTSIFEYHPNHNHWHTSDVALFEVRKGSPTGPIVGENSLKTGFCLLDLIRLDGNAPNSEKVFWDCWTSYQGVSAGWIDQYHQSTTGQQLDLTGVPDADDYYLVTTTNPEGVFVEQRTDNNVAWVRFSLTAQGNGNRKLAVLEHSPCESPGLCGAYSANRG